MKRASLLSMIVLPSHSSFEMTSARSKLTVVQMLALRLAIVLVMFAVVSSVAAAGESTTAVWSDGHRSVLTDEELMRYAVASPGAGYPQEAQKAKITGSGLYELQINKVGATTGVAIVKSSGSAVLDQAARSAFLKWRFKPGVFSRVRVPVSWSVNRVR
jgi:TonB family protein